MTEKNAVYEVTHTEVMNTDESSKSKKDINDVMSDKCSSDWLKWALRSALHRDPVDAANDANILEYLLEKRADEILKNETNLLLKPT